MKAAILIGAYFILAGMFIGVYAVHQRSFNSRLMTYGEDGSLRRLTPNEGRAAIIGSVLASSFLVALPTLCILPLAASWLRLQARIRVLVASASIGLLTGGLLSPIAYLILDGLGFPFRW